MESESDRRGWGQTREMEKAKEALRQSELDAAQRLQHVATQSIDARGLEALYEQILDTAVAVLHSDFASLQMFYPERGSGGELKLLGHRGFGEEAARRWEWVRPTNRTTCGEALRTLQRVAIADVRNCNFMAGSDDLEGYLGGGIHAVQTTPLVSRSGTLLGMLSTHWRDPHELSTSEVRALDVLARLAADLIERARGEEALRRSEERFRQVAEAAREFIWEVDAHGVYLYASPVVEQILGYVPEELVGKMHFYDLFAPETREETKAVAFEIFSRREPFRAFPSVNVRKDGRIVDLETSGLPILDGHGNLLGYRGVITDVTERKRAEAALQESEGRYRTLFEAMTEGFSLCEIVCDDAGRPYDFRYLGVNHMFERLTGLRPQDVVGRTALGVFPTAESVWFERYGKVALTGEPTHFEEWFGPLGRCFEVSAFQTQPGRFGLLYTDITERKEAEARLRESEARLQANEIRLMHAQRLAKIGSWERELDVDLGHWSDEVFRILGMAKEAHESFSAFLNCVHPKDRKKILDVMEELRSSRAAVRVDYRIIRPDGETRFVRTVCEMIRNDQGVPVRIVGATQDVTDQVKASEVLRQSEERLKNAERLTHAGNWHWDLKTNHMSWSDGTFRIFGKPDDYTPSYDEFLQAIIPADREPMEREVRDRLAGKTARSTEYQIVRPNGDVRTIADTAELIRDDEGSPAYILGACQDITDLKRAQEDALARQKLESVGTLANGIAHDFNNLLGGVLAEAELGLEELAAGSHPEEELKVIRETAIRGSEIVRQLMIYAGKEPEALEPVNISHIVEEMLPLLRISVSKHATLETDLGEDLPSVQANPAQLSQVVMNLVMNASEAIVEREGVIRVTTRCVTVGPDWSAATSELLAESDYLRLEVSDTGCGIPLETQAKVFGPFFTTKSAGHGLGLAVVHGIVRSLGGAIRLESEPGTGTTFQILLPCAETRGAETRVGATRGQTSRTEESTNRSQEATILVVEDEDVLRHAVSKMLHRSGFSVIETRDGSAALEAIRALKSPIEVLLLDITLPGNPSREVLDEARRLRPEMRVIATSAFSKDVAVETLQGRVEGFIRKPYRLGDLIDLVRHTLS